MAGGNRWIRFWTKRYPGHEATALIAKADQTIGTTTVSGWASELVQTVNSGFLNALTGMSVYPELRSRGVGLTFDGIGTISLPRRTVLAALVVVSSRKVRPSALAGSRLPLPA